MSDLFPSIRPTPQHLATMATIESWAPDEDTRQQIAAVSGAPCQDVLWELKLVTEETKYWLCTRGYAERKPGVIPDSFVVGRAIVDSLEPDPETGECALIDYGTEEVKELQGVDYLNALRAQLEEFVEEQEERYTREREDEVDDLRNEIESVAAAQGLKPLDLTDLDDDEPTA
jgi:hypothetical protein